MQYAYSVLFFIHSVRCWQGEFVQQLRAILVGDHYYCKGKLHASHHQGVQGLITCELMLFILFYFSQSWEIVKYLSHQPQTLLQFFALKSTIFRRDIQVPWEISCPFLSLAHCLCGRLVLTSTPQHLLIKVAGDDDEKLFLKCFNKELVNFVIFKNYYTVTKISINKLGNLLHQKQLFFLTQQKTWSMKVFSLHCSPTYM